MDLCPLLSPLETGLTQWWVLANRAPPRWTEVTSLIRLCKTVASVLPAGSPWLALVEGTARSEAWSGQQGVKPSTHVSRPRSSPSPGRAVG